MPPWVLTQQQNHTQQHCKHSLWGHALRQRELSSSTLTCHAMPLKLGLTGSIGMGKSTVASMFQDAGAAVFDADATVRDLYQPGGAAVQLLADVFPGVVGDDGGISRTALASYVVGDQDKLRTLEGIVHPLVTKARAAVVASCQSDVIVFDIPLLFETNAQKEVDIVVVVSAPADVQRDRVLARPGMTLDKFHALLSRQIPDDEKRQRADYIINTGCSLEETKSQVLHLLQDVCTKQHSSRSSTS